MIVVGFLGGVEAPGVLAFEIARRAAATGARVEMVGVAAADSSGDARLLALAAVGIGHATVVRSGATRLEPADLDLAFRYLPDIRCMILVAPEPPLVPVATAASAWAGAGLVIVGAAVEGDVGDAVVLEPPPSDTDGTFAGFVAALGVRLDAGDRPNEAWSSTVDLLAVDPVRQGQAITDA